MHGLAIARSMIALVGSLACTMSLAQAQGGTDCAGPVKDPHHLGHYDFVTNARLEPSGNAFNKVAIIPCVKNNKPSFLWIRWFVFDVAGFVPPNAALDFGPRLARHENAVFDDLKSCLEYGNIGETTKVGVLVRGEDKASIEKEAKDGCRETAVRYELPKEGEGVVEKLQHFFRLFIPSDRRDADRTMLRMEGTIGVSISKVNQYTSYVSYKVFNYEGSKGVVGEVTLRPSFRGPAAQLQRAYDAKNPEMVKLSEGGTIAFEVDDVRNPILTYASYEILDRKGELVGSLPFPVFVSR